MVVAAIAGFVFGFIGSVPVAGPIAVLVLERSLAQRYADAEGIALGGALAESFYAGAAFFGFGVLVERFPWMRIVARGLGAIVLVGVAIALHRGRNRVPESPSAEVLAQGRTRGFTLGFSLTAMNPTLLATWSVVVAMAFTAFSLELTTYTAIAFPFGVCLGVASWLFLFVRIIRRGGQSLSAVALDRVRMMMVVFVLGIATWFAYQAATAALT